MSLDRPVFPSALPSSTTPAPELIVQHWLNTPPLSLSDLKGQIVVIYAFQMLCPGCVSHSLPQAHSIQRIFRDEPITLIGLHSVFEHHAAMGRTSLEAFIHEYRLTFPIAIDEPSQEKPTPMTMARYQLQGTPSLLIIDQQGYLRLNHFGHLPDMQVGNIIGQLLREPVQTQTTLSEQQATSISSSDTKNAGHNDVICNTQGCKVPD